MEDDVESLIIIEGNSADQYFWNSTQNQNQAQFKDDWVSKMFDQHFGHQSIKNQLQLHKKIQTPAIRKQQQPLQFSKSAYRIKPQISLDMGQILQAINTSRINPKQLQQIERLEVKFKEIETSFKLQENKLVLFRKERSISKHKLIQLKKIGLVQIQSGYAKSIIQDCKKKLQNLIIQQPNKFITKILNYDKQLSIVISQQLQGVKNQFNQQKLQNINTKLNQIEQKINLLLQSLDMRKLYLHNFKWRSINADLHLINNLQKQIHYIQKVSDQRLAQQCQQHAHTFLKNVDHALLHKSADPLNIIQSFLKLLQQAKLFLIKLEQSVQSQGNQQVLSFFMNKKIKQSTAKYIRGILQRLQMLKDQMKEVQSWIQKVLKLDQQNEQQIVYLRQSRVCKILISANLLLQ